MEKEQIYTLTRGRQFGFDSDEIKADPVLALAAESASVIGGSIECSATSARDAFEIFFNCASDDPPEFLPDFFPANAHQFPYDVWHCSEKKYFISADD